MSSKVVVAWALLASLSFPAPHAVAEQVLPLHRGRWPVHGGFNHQPTQTELKTLHQQDVTPDQARQIDRLYDQLLSSSERILRQHPALVR